MSRDRRRLSCEAGKDLVLMTLMLRIRPLDNGQSSQLGTTRINVADDFRFGVLCR